MLAVFRPTKPDDVFRVAERLRPEDLEEARLLLKQPDVSPSLLLGACVIASKMSLTVWAGDTPVALCGVDRGRSAWFLATEEVESVSRSLLREAPAWLDFLGGGEPLFAYAWVGNPMHIRWARAVGFEIDPTFHHPHFIRIER